MSGKYSTVGKVGKRREVVIPKSVLDGLGLREGDLVEVTRTRNGALIKPKKLVDLEDETKNNAEYEGQKQAFDAIPAEMLAQYHGQFVVSHNGRIVDSDLDLVTLGRRFFGENGDVPAYVTKVGGSIEVRIRTPFIK